MKEKEFFPTFLALFSLKKCLVLATVALLFLFEKPCPNIE
jgi:hypothetical protein